MRAKGSNVRVPSRIGKPPKWLPLLQEFYRSDQEVYELIPDDGEYSNYKTLQSCACYAIRKSGLPISTYTKDGKVYLVKDNRGDEE